MSCLLSVHIRPAMQQSLEFVVFADSALKTFEKEIAQELCKRFRRE